MSGLVWWNTVVCKAVGPTRTLVFFTFSFTNKILLSTVVWKVVGQARTLMCKGLVWSSSLCADFDVWGFVFWSEDGEGGDNQGRVWVDLALMHFNVFRGISVCPFYISLSLYASKCHQQRKFQIVVSSCRLTWFLFISMILTQQGKVEKLEKHMVVMILNSSQSSKSKSRYKIYTMRCEDKIR